MALLWCLPHHFSAQQPSSNRHPFGRLSSSPGSPKEESAPIRKVAGDQTERSLKPVYWPCSNQRLLGEGQDRGRWMQMRVVSNMGEKLLEAALAGRLGDQRASGRCQVLGRDPHGAGVQTFEEWPFPCSLCRCVKVLETGTQCYWNKLPRQEGWDFVGTMLAGRTSRQEEAVSSLVSNIPWRQDPTGSPQEDETVHSVQPPWHRMGQRRVAWELRDPNS